MYIHIYVYIYIYICACVYIHTYMYIYIKYLWRLLSALHRLSETLQLQVVWVYVMRTLNTHTHTHIYIYIHIYIYMYIYIYIYVYIYMCVCVCVHTYIHAYIYKVPLTPAFRAPSSVGIAWAAGRARWEGARPTSVCSCKRTEQVQGEPLACVLNKVYPRPAPGTCRARSTCWIRGEENRVGLTPGANPLTFQQALDRHLFAPEKEHNTQG